MQLSELKESQQATVVKVGGSGALRRRILEMGILKGTDIYVEKYAPLKDPMELIVKGYHISLRVEEAAQISVDNVTPNPPAPFPERAGGEFETLRFGEGRGRGFA